MGAEASSEVTSGRGKQKVPEDPDTSELDAFIGSAKRFDWDEVFKILRSHPGYINMRPSKRTFAVIHQAAYQGNVAILKRLVEEFGADASLKSKDGKLPIYVAASEGNKEAVCYLEAVSAPSPRVLCIAGKETTAVVNGVAQKFGIDVVNVATMTEAIDHAGNLGPWGAVIAALGTRQGVDLLFDDDEEDRSILLETVKHQIPAPRAIVYSWTASKDPTLKYLCCEAGADAVLASAEELTELIAEIVGHSTLTYRRASRSRSVDVSQPSSEQDTQGYTTQSTGDEHKKAKTRQRKMIPVYASSSEYPVIAHRRARDQELREYLGSSHKTYRRSVALTEELEQMLINLPRPLTLSASADTSIRRPIRFVFIADSHGHHRKVHLPPGDVLLFGGDFLGNYGKKSGLPDQLLDFGDWLKDNSANFDKIILISGNHDTLLDRHQYPVDARAAREPFLQSLPQNVVYLENSGHTHEGVRIWGSPITVSRQETKGKRYCSDAFEAPRAARAQIWEQIPDGLHILLTHVPPRGRLCFEEIGDDLLTKRLREIRHPPAFHCFGHDHDYFGVEAAGQTTYINAAALEVFKADRDSQVCAWVFDIGLGGQE